MNPHDINIDDFPTLPTIYTQLMEVMSDRRSTIETVARVIEKDQSSVVKILKTVNSSVYGLNKKVDSIKDAIFYLGFQEVKNLVFSLSMVDMFKKRKNVSFFNIVDFWKHSIAVGVITRLLGKKLGVKKLDNYFISGIIHDIGKLYFVYYRQEEYAEAISKMIANNNSILQAEQKYMGSDHCRVGWQIACKWELPESLANSILHHPDGTKDGEYDQLVACVHLGNIIARALDLGNAGDIYVPKPNPAIWDKMDLANDTLSSLEEEIMINYNDSISILMVS